MKKDNLVSDPDNVRIHGPKSKSAIRASLEEVGPFRSIALDADNIVRAGNGVFEQAQEMGLKIKVIDAAPDELIAVRRKDLRGKKATRAALWDNATQQRSEWDYLGLGKIAQSERAALEGIFDEAEILASIRQAEMQDLTDQGVTSAEESKSQHDEKLREAHARWNAQLGDVWSINDGAGLLWCGDSREGQQALEVFGTPAEVIFTSPPYAAQRKEFYGGPPADEYVAWFDQFQASAKTLLSPTGSFLVNIKPHAENGERVLYVMDLVLQMKRQWGWRYVDELIWEKTGMARRGDLRFKNGFEPIHQFTLSKRPHLYPRNVAKFGETFKGAGKTALVGSGRDIYGGANVYEKGLVLPSNVIKVAENKESLGHSAPFPIKLAEFFVLAYAQADEPVLDIFSGSGTTMLAALQQNRRGFGIELKPEYVSLTLQRLSEKGYTCQRKSALPKSTTQTRSTSRPSQKRQKQK